MDINQPCTECGLPITSYMQNEHVREDICECCHIANTTEFQDEDE